MSEEWEQRYKFIISKSQIQQLTLGIAEKSGSRKFKMHESYKDFGLADAIIIETAIQEDLVIVSGDNHFKDLENILFLD